jgi:hypothetical protein
MNQDISQPKIYSALDCTCMYVGHLPPQPVQGEGGLTVRNPQFSKAGRITMTQWRSNCSTDHAYVCISLRGQWSRTCALWTARMLIQVVRIMPFLGMEYIRDLLLQTMYIHTYGRVYWSIETHQSGSLPNCCESLTKRRHPIQAFEDDGPTGRRS